MSGTYTKDDLDRLNHSGLKNIPEGVRYDALRRFVAHEKQVNLSNVVKQPVIPTYLKNRYGDSMITRGSNGSNGPNGPNKDAPRHKLCDEKNDTTADRINNEIRDLLTKISDSNKTKIFEEFMKKEIPSDCGQTLIDNIYLFAVDLTYLIHLYAEFVLRLREKNNALFQQLLEKILSTALTPLENKRLRHGNISLIAEIYRVHPEIIKTPDILKITQHILQHISPTTQEPIQLLTELLTKSIPRLLKETPADIDAIMKQLSPISHDSQYEMRYRFLIQDLMDLYNKDDS
jgi:hypothetical protein